MDVQDYYEILGVSKDASQDEIAKAYRSLATRFHPDKNLDNPEEASIKFKEINQAYEIIGNADKRFQYDNRNYDIGSKVSDIFGRFFHQRSRPDIRVELIISLEEAFSGCTKIVSVQRFRKCNDCQGSGAAKTETCSTCKGVGRKITQQGPFTLQTNCAVCKGTGKRAIEVCGLCNGTGGSNETEELNVDLPAGVEDGMHIKVSSKESDVYVLVLVKTHPFFVRYGADLVCQIPVTYTQLALGASIEIPTMSSETTLKIPPESQSGAKLKLRGMGLPHLEMPKARGDLYAIINLETPKNMTDEYKAALENLAKLEESQDYSKIKSYKKGNV